MTWLLRLVLVAGALIALACGESNGSDAGQPVTELTVLLPSGPDGRTQLDSFVTSFEYTIRCDSMELDGTLSKVATFNGGSKGPTAVWKGALSPLSEPCELAFIGRDDDGEAVCPWTEALPAPSEWPPELYFEAPCYQFSCTTTPLPNTVRKFCLDVVGLILSTEVPAALQIDRVEYVISGLTDFGSFIDDPLTTEVYRGELTAAGLGEADFGEGDTPIMRWDTAIEDVPAIRYLVEMTALDAEGSELCSAERRLDILPNAIAQIKVTMPCFTAEEGPP